MKEIKEYEVNPSTMALLGQIGKTGGVETRIIEKNHEFLMKMKPTMIIDQSCRYFGASLKGRQEGTREITGITHKPPIAIDPTNGIYMFPTQSPLKDTCAWFSHSHILKYDSAGYEETIVTMKNGRELLIDISFGSFENQLNRTAQFRYLLNERIATYKVKI
jgi:competence protein ComK